MNSAAVFTPIPGTPGTLSLESPTSAWTSIIMFGSTPNLFFTSSKFRILFFIGSKILTFFLNNCIRSLSEETIVTFAPFFKI